MAFGARHVCGLCEPDHMLGALSFAVGIGAACVDSDLLHHKAGRFQPPHETAILRRRPHRQHALGPQRRLGRAQAGAGIELVVLCAHQAIGAIIDIQQDRVKTARQRRDMRRNIADNQRHTRVIQTSRRQFRHRPARPFDDLGHQFHHGHGGIGGQHRQRGAQRKAHAIAADQHMRAVAPRDPFAAERCQRLFGPPLARAHQLVAVEDDHEVLVVGIEAQFLSAGDMGGIDQFARDHSDLLSVIRLAPQRVILPARRRMRSPRPIGNYSRPASPLHRPPHQWRTGRGRGAPPWFSTTDRRLRCRRR